MAQAGLETAIQSVEDWIREGCVFCAIGPPTIAGHFSRRDQRIIFLSTLHRLIARGRIDSKDSNLLVFFRIDKKT